VIIQALGTSINASGLLALGILVDGNDLLIGQNGERVISDGGQITTDDQGSLGESPQSEVGSLLL
jgi:hypothetical protein